MDASIQKTVSHNAAGVVIDIVVTNPNRAKQLTDATTRRRTKNEARRQANETAKVMAEAMRTGNKGSSTVASSFGMSHLELSGTLS